MRLLKWGAHPSISFLLRNYHFHSFNALIAELLYFKPQNLGKLMFKRRHWLLQACTCLTLYVLIHVSFMLSNTHFSKNSGKYKKENDPRPC